MADQLVTMWRNCFGDVNGVEVFVKGLFYCAVIARADGKKGGNRGGFNLKASVFCGCFYVFDGKVNLFVEVSFVGA